MKFARIMPKNLHLSEFFCTFAPYFVTMPSYYPRINHVGYTYDIRTIYVVLPYFHPTSVITSSTNNASTWRIALTWQSEKGRLAGSQADRELKGDQNHYNHGKSPTKRRP